MGGRGAGGGGGAKGGGGGGAAGVKKAERDYNKARGDYNTAQKNYNAATGKLRAFTRTHGPAGRNRVEYKTLKSSADKAKRARDFTANVLRKAGLKRATTV